MSDINHNIPQPNLAGALMEMSGCIVRTNVNGGNLEGKGHKRKTRGKDVKKRKNRYAYTR